MRAYKLDSRNSQIIQVDVNGIKDIQDIVEGDYFRVHHWDDTGDVLYVNQHSEDGENQSLIIVPGAQNVFIGNGLVIGHDFHTSSIKPVKMSMALLKKRIVLLQRIYKREFDSGLADMV